MNHLMLILDPWCFKVDAQRSIIWLKDSLHLLKTKYIFHSESQKPLYYPFSPYVVMCAFITNRQNPNFSYSRGGALSSMSLWIF